MSKNGSVKFQDRCSPEDYLKMQKKKNDDQLKD